MATNPFITTAAQMGQTMVDPEAQALQRQKQYAAMLMQQNQQPQGQMIGNRFVAPSWTQQLNAALNPVVGAYMMNKADTEQDRLAKALKEQYAQDIKQFTTSAKEMPEQAVYGAGEEGPTKQVIQEARPALSYGERIAQLSNSKSPQSQALAQALLTDALKTHVVGEGATVQRGTLEGVGGGFETVGKGADKSPEKIQTAAIVLGLDRKPRDQWTDQDRTRIDQQIQKTQQSGAVNLGQKGLDNTLKLRTDFRSEPIYKDFQAIDSAYRQINKGLDAKTAAGDLAASTKLMKLLDPGSVVRESELTMAMQATGKLDQLYNYANKVATGQFLSPTQKEEFRSLAKEFYNSAGEQYNSKRGEYAGIAQRNDLNVEDVVGKEVAFKEVKPTETKGMPSQTAIQQEINRRLGLKQQGGK
jgi:hypothetical protein